MPAPKRVREIKFFISLKINSESVGITHLFNIKLEKLARKLRVRNFLNLADFFQERDILRVGANFPHTIVWSMV